MVAWAYASRRHGLALLDGAAGLGPAAVVAGKVAQVGKAARGQQADGDTRTPAALAVHHQRLVALRHDDPVVVHGDFTMVLREHLQLYAYTRTLGDTTLLVVANLSDDPADASGLPDAEAWLGADRVLDSGPGDRDTWVLEPWSARVRRRTTGPATE